MLYINRELFSKMRHIQDIVSVCVANASLVQCRQMFFGKTVLRQRSDTECSPCLSILLGTYTLSVVNQKMNYAKTNSNDPTHTHTLQSQPGIV